MRGFSRGFGILPNKQKSPAVGRQKTDDFTERVPLSYENQHTFSSFTPAYTGSDDMSRDTPINISPESRACKISSAVFLLMIISPSINRAFPSTFLAPRKLLCYNGDTPQKGGRPPYAAAHTQATMGGNRTDETLLELSTLVLANCQPALPLRRSICAG